MKISKGIFLFLFFIVLFTGIVLFVLSGDFSFLREALIFDGAFVLGRFLAIHNFKFIPVKFSDND